MGRPFKHKLIGVAAVFATGAMSSIYANELADTTPAISGTVALPAPASSSMAAQSTSGGPKKVNFSYLPAGAIKVVADSATSIAGAAVPLSNTLYVPVSGKPTGLVFTPLFSTSASNQGRVADIYVIAYYQGMFLSKKKTPAGCAGWTIFSPQNGGLPQVYEAVALAAIYQFGNINDCDVTALKGVSYYIGYGIGSNLLNSAQTWNAMLANGTFSNNPVLLTN